MFFVVKWKFLKMFLQWKTSENMKSFILSPFSLVFKLIRNIIWRLVMVGTWNSIWSEFYMSSLFRHKQAKRKRNYAEDFISRDLGLRNGKNVFWWYIWWISSSGSIARGDTKCEMEERRHKHFHDNVETRHVGKSLQDKKNLCQSFAGTKREKILGMILRKFHKKALLSLVSFHQNVFLRNVFTRSHIESASV